MIYDGSVWQWLTGNLCFPFSVMAVFWKTEYSYVFYGSFRQDVKLYMRRPSIYANSQTRYESEAGRWTTLHAAAEYMMQWVIMVVPR